VARNMSLAARRTWLELLLRTGQAHEFATGSRRH
jgi:hypothetical protein